MECHVCEHVIILKFITLHELLWPSCLEYLDCVLLPQGTLNLYIFPAPSIAFSPPSDLGADC